MVAEVARRHARAQIQLDPLQCGRGECIEVNITPAQRHAIEPHQRYALAPAHLQPQWPRTTARQAHAGLPLQHVGELRRLLPLQVGARDELSLRAAFEPLVVAGKAPGVTLARGVHYHACQSLCGGAQRDLQHFASAADNDRVRTKAKASHDETTGQRSDG